MNLSHLTDEQLSALWEKAHRNKYRWGMFYRHAYRAQKIQHRVFNEESLRKIRNVFR